MSSAARRPRLDRPPDRTYGDPISRWLLVLVATIAALAIAGCGGGDGGDEGIDVDAFESCLKDEGLDVSRDDDQVEGIETQPTALFLVEGASQTDFGIAVPAQVSVFENEDDAAAAQESIGDDGPIGADRSGAVVWIYPDISGATIDDEVASTFESCAEEAS